MLLSCYVVDDEPLALELMVSYVKKTPFLELCGVFDSSVAVANALRERPVDLLFCDIQMPEMSGVELSRTLPSDTRVIFTTAHDNYAVEGFRVNAIDYLLKPISYSNFLVAAEKALQWFTMRRSAESASAAPGAAKTIFVKTEYRLQQIELAKVLYIEGLKDYVKIYVEGAAHPILSLMSLKSLESLLPSDSFIRVHRSYIVQPSKIAIIERNRIVFCKEYVPISDNYRQAFYDFLASHSLMPE